MSSVLQSAMSEYSMPPHLQISLSNLFFNFGRLLLILRQLISEAFLTCYDLIYSECFGSMFVHEQVANHHHCPPSLSVGWIMLKYHIPWRFKQWKVLRVEIGFEPLQKCVGLFVLYFFI